MEPMLFFEKESPEQNKIPLTAFRRLMYAMRLNQMLMSQQLNKHHAFVGQMLCLQALHDGQGISQNELAARMLIRPPTVSRMLMRLEEMGCIRREEDSADRRITRIYLTPDGEKLLFSLGNDSHRCIEETLGSLAPADQRELCRILGEYVNILQKAIGKDDEKNK